jgi:hypothetical protein
MQARHFRRVNVIERQRVRGESEAVSDVRAPQRPGISALRGRRYPRLARSRGKNDRRPALR